MTRVAVTLLRVLLALAIVALVMGLDPTLRHLTWGVVAGALALAPLVIFAALVFQLLLSLITRRDEQ